MKRDFNQVMLNFDQRPYIRPMGKFDAEGLPVTKDGQPEFSHYEKMTLRTFALEALAGRWKGDENMTVDESTRRARLYDKLCFTTDGVVDIDNAEAQMLLDCLLKQGRDPIVVARMKHLLDSDPKSVAPVVNINNA
jgi:hypothetical protein